MSPVWLTWAALGVSTEAPCLGFFFCGAANQETDLKREQIKQLVSDKYYLRGSSKA